jgi:glycine/D-amino acid oxidase-like deaminating enzyme
MAMSSHYDVIVLGIGAMGSATLYHLARRGRRDTPARPGTEVPSKQAW